MKVTVLGARNQELPSGQIGEVCIRGPNVTKGYINRPEANKEAFAGCSPCSACIRHRSPSACRQGDKSSTISDWPWQACKVLRGRAELLLLFREPWMPVQVAGSIPVIRASWTVKAISH